MQHVCNGCRRVTADKCLPCNSTHTLRKQVLLNATCVSNFALYLQPADEGGPFMLSDDDSDSHSTTTQATTTNTQGMPVLAVGQPVPARAL